MSRRCAALLISVSAGLSVLVTPPASADIVLGTSLNDTFTRTVSGGWGSSDGTSGGGWTISTPAAASVNGHAGLLALAPGATVTARTNRAFSPRFLDSTMTLGVSAVPVNGSLKVQVVGGGVVGGRNYQLGLTLGTDQSVRLGWTVNTSATGHQNSTTSTVSGLRYSPTSPLRVRVQATQEFAFGGGPLLLRAKVWALGTTEPAAWTTSFVSPSWPMDPMSAGSPAGVSANLSPDAASAVNVTVDDVRYVRRTAALVLDSFNSTKSAGWADPDVAGGTWTLSGPNFSQPTAGQGAVTLSGPGTQGSAYQPAQLTSVDVLERMSFHPQLTGGSFYATA